MKVDNFDNTPEKDLFIDSVHSTDIYKDAKGGSPLVFSSGDISFSKRNIYCLNKLIRVVRCV